MKTADQLKQQVASHALRFVNADEVLGVGTGSTVNYFIQALAETKLKVKQAVSSSVETSKRLQAIGVEVVELGTLTQLSVYIDGADEINNQGQMIKGGGGALSREKIIAQAAKTFVCIVSEEKCVQQLGKFPLPLEVIPIAKQQIIQHLSQLGASAVWRKDYVTDNGMHILDVVSLDLQNPRDQETYLNQIPGVVTVGLFAHRGADVLVCAKQHEIVEKVFANES